MGGIGPGIMDLVSPMLVKTIEKSDIIIGYKKYLGLIDKRLLQGKEIKSFNMQKEVERAKFAVSKALEGKVVTVVSSGDPGVYGMASLVIEEAVKSKVEVEVIPGITAALAAASLLGSPLTLDFAVISLSDILVTWESIENKLKALSLADIVIVIYNPASSKRRWQLQAAVDIILENRKSTTPTGIVKNCYRNSQEVIITELARLKDYDIDMNTIIIIGNSETIILDGMMINPRGYKK